MKYAAWIVVLLSILLVGCDSDSKQVIDLKLKYVTTDSVPVDDTDHAAQAKMAESSASVGHSLQKLSAISMATHSHAKLKAPLNPKAIGMEARASINWNGPLKSVLQQVASATNYKLHVVGKEPAIPVIISLDAHHKTFAEILRNITYQAEPNAIVELYPAKKTIELRYAKS